MPGSLEPLSPGIRNESPTSKGKYLAPPMAAVSLGRVLLPPVDHISCNMPCQILDFGLCKANYGR